MMLPKSGKLITGNSKAWIGNVGELAKQTDIDTLKTSVSEGKSLIATAVTGKGVQTAADATFQTMATNISSIAAQEYVTVSFSGNSQSCTITFYGYTVNGKSECSGSELYPSFKVPKNACFKVYVGSYHLSLRISGGPMVGYNDDNNGNWEYEVVAATKNCTITVNYS